MASKNLKNLFWLCLFSATLTAVPCKVAAKSAALLVGIKIPGEDNEYVDMGKKISHLFFDFDSEDGKVKLSRNGQTLEAIFDIVVYMTSDAVDFSGKNASRPTKQNIESELQSLAGKDLDILFVYYGTHGFENKLLHEGCDLEEENEYWDVNDFITQLVVPAAQPVARKIFLVIEACYVEGMAIANVDMKDLKPLKADTLFAITTGTGLVKPGFLDIFQENLNTSKSYDSDDLAHLIKKEIPNRIRKQKPKVISSTKKKFKVIDKKPYVQIKQEEHGEDAFPQDVAVKASLQFQGYDDLVLGQLPITEPKKVNDSFIKEHGVLRLEPIAWRDPAGRQFKATDVYKTHSIDFTLWPGVNEISLDSRHLPKKLKSITGEIKDQYREPVSGAKVVLSGLEIDEMITDKVGRFTCSVPSYIFFEIELRQVTKSDRTLQIGGTSPRHPPASGIWEIAVETPTSAPNLLGKTEQEARKTLRANAFTLKSINPKRVSRSEEHGRVIDQVPEPGEFVTRRELFILNIGRYKLKMPVVHDKKVSIAIEELENAGLRVKDISERPVMSESEEGIVLEQTPHSESEVELHSEVSLVIGKYKKTMPDLVGEQIERIYEMDKSFYVFNINEVTTSDESLHKTIISQSPSPGTLIDNKMTITIDVYWLDKIARLYADARGAFQRCDYKQVIDLLGKRDYSMLPDDMQYIIAFSKLSSDSDGYADSFLDGLLLLLEYFENYPEKKETENYQKLFMSICEEEVSPNPQFADVFFDRSMEELFNGSPNLSQYEKIHTRLGRLEYCNQRIKKNSYQFLCFYNHRVRKDPNEAMKFAKEALYLGADPILVLPVCVLFYEQGDLAGAKECLGYAKRGLEAGSQYIPVIQELERDINNR